MAQQLDVLVKGLRNSLHFHFWPIKIAEVSALPPNHDSVLSKVYARGRKAFPFSLSERTL
jgi:hypothetical protein